MQGNTVCEIEIHEYSQRFSWGGDRVRKRWHHCSQAKRQKVLQRRIFVQNLFIAAINMQQLDLSSHQGEDGVLGSFELLQEGRAEGPHQPQGAQGLPHLRPP